MKILVVYYGNRSSFIEMDIEILSRHHSVVELGLCRMVDVPRLFGSIVDADLVFVWFAGKHAGISVLLAGFLHKASIVVVGGYDAARVPEIGYGLWAVGGPLDKALARLALKRAGRVLVVDPSLKDDLVRNAGINGSNVDYVPTGYDYNYWVPYSEKEDIVLTVGEVNWTNVRRKGFETFVRAAAYVPEARFVLAGKHADDSIEYLRSISPQNVEFTGWLSREELRDLYGRAKVYCQLSLYEGLPNALCEAMLGGCVPVGTRRNGIPTAIGDTGFYVPYGDPEATAEAVKKALRAPREQGLRARQRIKSLFPLERREKELLKIINELILKERRA